jgi:hypothetical protein
MGTPKTPQEKKRLSLSKDRRNTYGENDKASRKNVRRAKARVNRADRHQDHQILDGAVGAPDDDIDDAVEQAVLGRRRKFWRKSADTPLGEVLDRRRSKSSDE